MSEDGKYEDGLARRIEAGLAKCKERGLSRRVVSKRLGYKSESSLSKWATGEATPQGENLAALSRATGLSLDWLMNDHGPMFIAAGDAHATKLEVIGVVADEKVDLETAEKIRQSVQAIVHGEGEDVDGMRADTEGASPFGDGRDDRRKAEPK